MRIYASSPHANLVQFSGKKATQTIRDTSVGPLSPEDLQEILDVDDTPYVNHLPDALLKQVNLPELKVLGALDEAVDLIRKREFETLNQPHASEGFLKGLFTNPTSRKLQELKAQLRPVELGCGRNARVYKVTLGGKPYALKVFKYPRNRQTLQPYAETAIGAYFTAQETKNMSHLYVANPSQGWMLMEYIGPDDKLENRTGETLFDHGFFIDDASTENFINNIRVDYGGTVYPCKDGRRGVHLQTGQYIE